METDTAMTSSHNIAEEPSTSPRFLIHHICGKYFVWNAMDVHTLRTQHRICGNLVGSNPHKPWQSIHKSVPLILLPAEAHFCYKHGIARIVDGKDYFKRKVVSLNDVASFHEKRQATERDQIKKVKERFWWKVQCSKMKRIRG